MTLLSYLINVCVTVWLQGVYLNRRERNEQWLLLNARKDCWYICDHKIKAIICELVSHLHIANDGVVPLSPLQYI